MDAPLTLFVYKSEKCAQLVKDLYEVVKSSGRRLKIRVVRAKIRSPDEFPAFLTYLEEIYGPHYVSEYKKYGIEKLPALVVGGVKLFEGYFPSREELAELLAREGLARPQPREEPRPAPPSPMPAARVRRAGCRGCIFYLETSSRCTLLHVRVESPENPPCGGRGGS